MDIKQKLKQWINEYPNDFVVIATQWNSDFKISPPFTYIEEARKYYKFLSKRTNINYKIGIYQLNCFALKGFLRSGLLL